VQDNCYRQDRQGLHADPYVKLIEYKAKFLRVEVVKVKETYTSGVSAYDLEPLTKKFYNKKRRVKRGLFKTNEGHLVMGVCII
jgi:hypothetical protein